MKSHKYGYKMWAFSGISEFSYIFKIVTGLDRYELWDKKKKQDKGYLTKHTATVDRVQIQAVQESGDRNKRFFISENNHKEKEYANMVTKYNRYMRSVLL